MQRWNNRVAVVTGASSGIGAAIAVNLVKAGLVVAGLARRVERVEELKGKLPENLRSKLHAVKCDVSKDDSVTEAFDCVEKKLKTIDVLVNNAGIVRWGQIVTMDLKDMQEVMQVNVFGVIRCTRRAFKSMKERNFDGHIININSVVGHNVITFPGRPPISNIYPPSKFALRAMTEILALEFKHENTKIKMTSVSPGLTDTEVISADLREYMKNILRPEDISDAVLYALGTPAHVQVKEVIVRPVGETL